MIAKGVSMYIDIQTLVPLLVSLTALGTSIIALMKTYNRVYGWVKKQDTQDKDIKNMKSEMTLMCFCMSASLDGLIQLGANHDVPVAKDKLDKYLNQKAHDQEGK